MSRSFFHLFFDHRRSSFMFVDRQYLRPYIVIRSGRHHINRLNRSALAASCGLITIGAYALYNQSSSSIVSCAPSSSSSPPARPVAPISHETVRSYTATGSRMSALPTTLSSIQSSSLDQLGSIYSSTPTVAESVISTIVNVAVEGVTPTAPSAGLDAISLTFTSADPDPFHRHMETLTRLAQDAICNDVMDMESYTLADGTPVQTIDRIDGVALNDSIRALLINQGSVPGTFRETVVIRSDGSGGGIERVMAQGRVFAKAGVNVSVARVMLPANRFSSLASKHPSLDGVPAPTESVPLFTASVSLVLHPVNPHVPTVHANYRYFEMKMPNGGGTHWWFGGGSDLTPTYVVDEDATHFHKTLSDTLAPIGKNYYPEFKKWCDSYFFIPHRRECRGVGGVFFDDQHKMPRNHYELLVRKLSQDFSKTYFPIVIKRMNQPFTESEVAYQQHRRGRYVEFNLVYDQGTTYGLAMPNCRIDAILMSLPPIARFKYKQTMDEPREVYTEQVVKTPKEWIK